MRLAAAWVALITTGLSPAMANSCIEGFYTNVSGHRVHRPECVTHHVDHETAVAAMGPTVSRSIVKEPVRIMVVSIISIE